MSEKQKAYRITRIRLVNFHNFIDETIDLIGGGHLFLLGDNGCGKTTILDAIHYVLSAGTEMEFNAAARIAGSKREGRRAQGIVMRYNLDCGVMNPHGGVTYALLEIEGRQGMPLTIGIGLTVSAMDERLQQWGVIRECPLSEIPLIIEDEIGRRPAGRLELKERMGTARGFYKDAKSYRQELAVRLFADQENYREVCRFLAMGKAYREIASQAADYHELFKSLLPEPKTDIFERIIEALRTLDESKSILDDLERKLDYLQTLNRLLDVVATNREAVIRYEWLHWHSRAATAEKRSEELHTLIAQTTQEMEARQEKRRQEEAHETALGTRLDDLKTKDAAGLVRQEQECRKEFDRKTADLTTQQQHFGESEKKQQETTRARGILCEKFRQAAARLHGELGEIAPKLPFSIAEFLTALDTAHRSGNAAHTYALNSGAIDTLLEEHRNDLLRRETLTQQRYGDLQEERGKAEKQLEKLQKDREIRPDIPGFSQCLQAMKEKMLFPRPLYQGLEWRPGLDRREMSRIEECIGAEICAILLLKEEEFESGREVAAEFPAIRITTKGRGLPTDLLPEWIRTAFDIQHSAPNALRCLAAEMISEFGPLVARVGGRDILSFRSHDRRLSENPSRLIGAQSRQEALAVQIKAVEIRLKELRSAEKSTEQELKDLSKTKLLLDSLRSRLRAGLHALQDLARQVAEAERSVEAAKEIHGMQSLRRQEMERETEYLSKRLQDLVLLINSQGLADLDQRIKSLSAKLQRQREKIRQLDTGLGELQNAQAGYEKQTGHVREERQAAITARHRCEVQLQQLLPEIDDLAHYILRTRKGFQFKTIDAVQTEMNRAKEAIVENQAILRERLNDPEFGPAFRFLYDDETNVLTDFRSRQLVEIVSHQEADITEQNGVINDQTKELFKKIIMTELVNYLRGHVGDLDRMMNNIRNLLERRSFGGQQYRFKMKPLEKYRGLVKIIKKFSPFDPAAEEELSHFFEDHREEIVNTEVGGIPEELDYRNWYRYEMEVVAAGDQGVVMDRHTKSIGSGGEQAVPNYLLVLTIAHFLYHGKRVRLHTLLFDEAFYGIDAGRRDQLLGFASDLDLQLFVASPDQDGVRREIRSSTTILIKKDPEYNVHLYPFHWENPDNIKQVGIFDQPVPEKPVAFEDELGGSGD